jgi:hypothetical protein
VFAKTDLQPLLNEGASRPDLAASVLQAVVTQTIAGLACGHPIRGHVALLGGPLHFLPSLREAFRKTLENQVQSMTAPDDAQLYVSIGAALIAADGEGDACPLSEIAERFRDAPDLDPDVGACDRCLPTSPRRPNSMHGTRDPTWSSKTYRNSAANCYPRHRRRKHHHQSRPDRPERPHPFHHYGRKQRESGGLRAGDPGDVVQAVAPGREDRPGLRDGLRGALIQAAFGVDDGEIETMAHFRRHGITGRMWTLSSTSAART